MKWWRDGVVVVVVERRLVERWRGGGDCGEGTECLVERERDGGIILTMVEELKLWKSGMEERLIIT